MKILTIWMWAFWLAILNHLSKTHPETTFYAYEKNQISVDFMKENRVNPYFFIWEKLSDNIVIVDNLENEIKETDLIIIAIPNQFVKQLIIDIKPYLKSWVSFLNLSKWIDNSNLKTVSDNIKEELWDFKYNYSVLSWWMIATEVFYFSKLWAQIWYSNEEIWNKLKKIFETTTLKIDLTSEYKNIELYWAFKNIMALYVGYLEWKWYEYSSIWYHFCEMFSNIEKLIIDLWWINDFNFKQYALGWDIIATCFWNSRNKYLWKLVWSGKQISEALEILRIENKHAEWYETLKWVRNFIKDKKNYEKLNELIDIFL